MADEAPTPTPAPATPATPPENPAPPTPVSPAPEEGAANSEVIKMITELRDTVAQLVNKETTSPDETPVKLPWTHRGWGKR